MPGIVLSACLLSACGGGGGGGGASVAPSFPLGSTPSTTPQDLTTLPQLTELQVTFSTAASVEIANGSYFVSLPAAPRVGIRTSAGAIVEVALSVPGVLSAGFTNIAPQPLDNNVVPSLAWASERRTVNSRLATIDLIDPEVGQLQYHTFGTWGYQQSTPLRSSIGYVVLGAPTPTGSVPTTGSASYSGAMTAIYTAASLGSDSLFDVTAQANALVDFNARSVTFSTSNTVRQSLVNAVVTPDAALNLSGVLSYGPGANAFSGTITTANGLSGTANGAFFGPLGQEIGGAFVLRDNHTTPTTHMFGAFGLHQ